MGMIGKTYNKLANAVKGNKSKDKYEEIKQDPFIIGDSKDVVLHLFKHHNNINNNINLADFQDSQLRRDFVFQQMRLANMMYEYMVLSEESIINLIKQDYLTIDVNTKEIKLKGDKKYILSMIDKEVSKLKSITAINGAKIKSILHEDVKNLTLLNRNKSTNYFSSVGFPKYTQEDMDKSSNIEAKANEDMVVRK